MNPEATLGELGLDSLMGVEVKQALERGHELSLPMREIRLLTVNRLKHIAETGSSEGPSAETKPGGTSAGSVSNLTQNSKTSESCDSAKEFLPVMPQEALVMLSEGADRLGPHSKCLFIVHPIEGVVTSLKQLSTLIKRPVYGLQCTKDADVSSVPNLAKYYIEVNIGYIL